MNELLFTVIAALLSYLLGSLDFAIIVSRLLKKEDVRSKGSGNAGMTNVLRVYGVFPAVLTAAGDFGKTILAVFLSRRLFGAFVPDGSFDIAYVSALFAMLGHLFPVYFGFKGGKGSIISIGVTLAIHPLLCLILIAVFVPIAFITRIVSIASIAGAIFMPFITLAFCLIRHEPALLPTATMTICGILVIWRHRENIMRLKSKEEKPLYLNKKKEV